MLPQAWLGQLIFEILYIHIYVYITQTHIHAYRESAPFLPSPSPISLHPSPPSSFCAPVWMTSVVLSPSSLALFFSSAVSNLPISPCQEFLLPVSYFLFLDFLASSLLYGNHCLLKNHFTHEAQLFRWILSILKIAVVECLSVSSNICRLCAGVYWFPPTLTWGRICLSFYIWWFVLNADTVDTVPGSPDLNVRVLRFIPAGR